jgi:hypothetical protein
MSNDGWKSGQGPQASTVRLARKAWTGLAAIPIILIAVCGTAASAEDAGEITRTSPGDQLTSSTPGYSEICRTMQGAAVDNNLPVDFFTRVIWRESNFEVSARSPAGALGIAQFMPKTASSRGLLNPFDPIASLRESASYLRELNKTFGNLGLAAAAYNAGPGRVAQWLLGNQHLPSETITYVRLVTGRPISAWTSVRPSWEGSGIPQGVPCTLLASRATDELPLKTESKGPRPTAWAPWGVQLTSDWTRNQVLSKYEWIRRKYFTVLGDREPLVLITFGPSGLTKRYLARVATNTQQEADQLCKRLQSLGSSCFAIRNRPQ